ncbi:MAG TPA: hypothetical protein DCK95_03015 [Anaerolineaceae bacterium]|nr:hypothetical protein [Anaerolineaceae bacterium]
MFFLGSHIVREALKDGYAVRAFIQPGRDVDVLDGLPVERFESDLLNKHDIESALQDCQMLIHTAGTTAVFPSQTPWIWEINYRAVVDLAQAARAADIARFVHISSACTFGYGSEVSPDDENSPYLGAKFHLIIWIQKERHRSTYWSNTSVMDFLSSSSILPI